MQRDFGRRGNVAVDVEIGEMGLQAKKVLSPEEARESFSSTYVLGSVAMLIQFCPSESVVNCHDLWTFVIAATKG